MTDIKEEIVYLKVKDLIPYEYNAREHGSEIEFLKNSIKRYKFRNPILVDKDLVIIAGHGRRIAAMELGMEEVPCVICEDLNEEEVRALRLSDNKVADLSGWDFDKMDMEVQSLTDLGWDMQAFGFEDMSQFDVSEPEETEVIDGGMDFVTESEAVVKEDYRIMVSLSSKSEQDELFEYLVRNGYDCQLLK